MPSSLRRLLVGQPIASTAESKQRLVKVIALAVFASDAISSTSYATEEILGVLIPNGGLDEAISTLLPISGVVIILLGLVAFSYRQTIHAYPGGGGSYIVSRENLGRYPSLVAAASLLVDYTLTVAVSVSAGVAAITSAVPGLQPHTVWLCAGIVAALMLANLRGLRDSGRVFAIPTYLYIASLGALVVWGLFRSFTGSLAPLPADTERVSAFTDHGLLLTGLTPFLLMRAFSSGAIALSGVEAISNGVPVFRKPEARNAAMTLTWMAAILASGFFFLALLVTRVRPTPYPPGSDGYQTLLSILGREVFGGPNAMYVVLQASTALILILAANTAFADFPRLASIIAADRFLPNQFTIRGDRLVFSNGIIALAVGAVVLLVAFGGVTASLVPLYAVGVFAAFTLSQFGMVRRHRRLRESGWRGGLAINALGGAATLLVLIDVVISKFTIGAWIPIVLIPLIVLGFVSIRRHYDKVSDSVRLEPGWRPVRRGNVAVVVVTAVNRGAVEAVAYAESLCPGAVHAVTAADTPETAAQLRSDWDDAHVDVPLEVLDSPYRRYVDTFADHLAAVAGDNPDAYLTVVLPEYSVDHAWESPLHNQGALLLSSRLHTLPNTAVVAYRFHSAADE